MIFKKRNISNEEYQDYRVAYETNPTDYYDIVREEYAGCPERHVEHIKERAKERLEKDSGLWSATIWRYYYGKDSARERIFIPQLMLVKESISFELAEHTPNEFIAKEFLEKTADFKEKKKYKAEVYNKVYNKGNRSFGPDKHEIYADSIWECFSAAKTELIKGFSFDIACIYKIDDDNYFGSWEGNLEKIIEKIDICYKIAYYNEKEMRIVGDISKDPEYEKEDKISVVSVLRCVEKYCQKHGHLRRGKVKEIIQSDKPGYYSVIFEFIVGEYWGDNPTCFIKAEMGDCLKSDLSKLIYRDSSV
jgi:hypothetical protein